MATSVVVHEAAIKQWAREEPAQAALDLVTGEIFEAARGFTPVGRRPSGGYARRKWSIIRYPLRRRIINRDPFFHLIEYGSVKNPTYAPLRRAARAVCRRLGITFSENTEKNLPKYGPGF